VPGWIARDCRGTVALLAVSAAMAVVACAAVLGQPAPAGVAPRSAEPPRPIATTGTRGWTGDAAVAALRSRLRVRGYGPEVAAGPMLARWDAAAPPSPLAGEPALPLSLRRSTPGAWLVATEAGAWYVWEAGDRGPLLDPPIF
jgi:hypothetical protein